MSLHLGIYNLQFTIYKSFTNYNLCIYDNLQIGCKFTNDKGTLHWSHTEPLMVGGGGVDEKLTQQDQEGLAFKGGLPMRGGGEGKLCSVLILCCAHSDNLAFCMSLI